MAAKKKENVRHIKMVLYKMHDYDLVSYYMRLKEQPIKDQDNKRIFFCNLVKDSLKEYTAGNAFQVPDIDGFYEKELPSKIYVKLILDKEKDSQIIELIDGIKDRQINSFLKSLIRRNMTVRGLNCYFQGNHQLEGNGSPHKTKEQIKKEIEAKAIRKLNNIEPEPEPVMAKTEEKNVSENPSAEEFDFFGALGNINK